MTWPPAIPKWLLKITIYKPAQVKKLVTLLWKKGKEPTAESALLFVVLGAFAGLRTTEITGLDWSGIDFGKKQISLKPTTSKRNRVVPIQDNLLAFLLPFKGRKGLVVAQKNISALVRAYCKEIGVEHIRDGFRHSYATYRLVTSSVEALQHEMGIGSAMMHKHLRSGCTPAAATRYWRIHP